MDLHGLFRRGIGAALAAVLALPLAAWGAPTDDVRGIIDRVLEIARDPGRGSQPLTKERRAQIRKAVRERFNFVEMARRGLAGHWSRIALEDQETFVDLFRELLESAYLDKVEYFTDEKILYLGERIDGDRATVMSKVVTKRNLEIPIEYKLLQRYGRWEVYDFVIEGVSLVENYRLRINKIIRTRSYAELMRLMRVKLEAESVEVQELPRTSEEQK